MEDRMKYHIIESIKFLATSADRQLSYLPVFIHKPDEIVSMLDDWLDLYERNEFYRKKPLFSETEYVQIKSLNDMVGNIDKSELTIESVNASFKWEEVRIQARFVLETLHVEYTFPTANLL